jgi:hypothetical protein
MVHRPRPRSPQYRESLLNFPSHNILPRIPHRLFTPPLPFPSIFYLSLSPYKTSLTQSPLSFQTTLTPSPPGPRRRRDHLPRPPNPHHHNHHPPPINLSLLFYPLPARHHRGERSHHGDRHNGQLQVRERSDIFE